MEPFFRAFSMVRIGWTSSIFKVEVEIENTNGGASNIIEWLQNKDFFAESHFYLDDDDRKPARKIPEICCRVFGKPQF